MTDGVPTIIVEKLISTIVELTKQVTSMPHTISSSMSDDIDKVTIALAKVADRMNTPPRHEELSVTLNEIKVLTANMSGLLKQTIRTIKIAGGLFSLAILIASIVMYFGTAYIDHKQSIDNHSKIELQIEEIKKAINNNGK